MPGCERVMKAAIIHLNVRARTIADLETALVIQSLYRKNGLSQVEIAALLDRHKSFVCRRLQLVEKLSESDRVSVRIGIELYNKNPSNVTAIDVLEKIKKAGNELDRKDYFTY